MNEFILQLLKDMFLNCEVENIKTIHLFLKRFFHKCDCEIINDDTIAFTPKKDVTFYILFQIENNKVTDIRL